MRATEPTLIRVWADMVAYARQKCEAYGLDAGEADDIVIDAYEKARGRLRGTKVRKDRKAAIKSIAWSAVLNELKRRNTGRERILREAVRLDAREGGRERAGREGGAAEGSEASVDLSDQGYGAANRCREDWVQMTREQIERERDDCRKVVTQFLKSDMTHAKARREAKLGRKAFGDVIRTLRGHFDRCFRAYLACQAEYFATKYGVRMVVEREDGARDEVEGEGVSNPPGCAIHFGK